MPLRQSSARKRRTQGLRQRMRTLTRYEPENASTDDENDSDRPVGVTLPHGHHHRQSHSHKSVAQQATEQSVLKKVDVEILRIIAGLADQRAHTRTRARIEQQRQNDYSGRYNYNGKEKEEDDDLDFVDAFQAFEAFTELNNLTRNNYRNFFTVLNILINLCGQAPLPQERDTWSTRLSAYLQTYSAAELRRANNTLLRARLHSFDNRTRDRFLGLWYESYSAQTERDKKLGEIAAQYNWCRVVAAPLQLWFTRLTEQRAREAAAGAKADLRLKRRMFDRLLARCQAVTVAEEKADRLTKGLAEEVLTGWINRTKRIVQMDNQAAEEDRAILINDVFQQWARSFDIVDDMYAHAELASDTLALKHTLATWKRRTKHDTALLKNTRLAEKFLAVWRTRNAVQAEREAEATNVYNQGIVRHAFYSLMYRDDQLIDQANTADKQYRLATLKAHLAQWRGALVHLKTQRREAALATFQKEQATRLADKYLNLWFGRYVDVEELETTGDELAAEREMAMKREALVVWAERARTVAENAREADRQVAARALVRWHESHERVAQLETDADDFVLASNLQLVERTYRAWRMRMFKVRTKARDADDFNKQLGEQRFKAVWRYWKLRTWELQNERALMPTMSQRQPQKQQHPPAANFLQQRESVMRSYSILRRPLVHATATNPRPVPQLVAFTAPEPALAPAEPPDQAETPAGPAADEEYAPETPTRPHVRKTVPYTSLGRWRRARTPAGRLLGTGGGGGGGGAATIPRFEPASQFPITQSNAAAAAATAMSPSYGR
ncbi:hypothetical protein DV495_001554 [Geotrichum candidum]|nr:hypothetical protein DV452_004468 [Geotrichum candidum]KAF5114526.1 hypothetical protein DV454_002923 [Geotrichum candidum]KAF5132147.1 hypothetical protein DV495_001554 [Geotrichum candidum]KAI9213475.1 hypothetical protein DS838_001648 [Geotrichum bryndzae]